MNIRSGPSTGAKVIGKLYDGCVANIISREGDWIKIQSGNIETGYVHAQYLLSGWDAEDKMAETCERIATVTCSILNVRAGMGTEYKICGQIARGESYRVTEVAKEWVKVILGQDERTGEEITGYVSKKYVDVEYQFQYALTLAEDKAQQDEKLRNEIITYAVQFVGNPYVWGGTSLTKGADCSGFVQTIYGEFGYEIPRVSKDQAVEAGYRNVIPDKEHLLPGDLIFYADEYGVVNHVAMYIGDGMIVHAASKKKGIIIAKYTMRKPVGARRVVGQ